MYKHFTIKLFILTLFLGIVSSCVKESNFPKTPIIKFEKFVLFKNDSADCYISFTDGDGDIGVIDGDSVAEPDLKMKYLFKGTDDLFHPFDSNPGTLQFDTLFYNNRVPFITPDGQYKALEGEIKIKLRAAPLFNPLHTVVKFEITLRDRAGNLSNTVYTDEINVIP